MAATTKGMDNLICICNTRIITSKKKRIWKQCTCEHTELVPYWYAPWLTTRSKRSYGSQKVPLFSVFVILSVYEPPNACFLELPAPSVMPHRCFCGNGDYNTSLSLSLSLMGMLQLTSYFLQTAFILSRQCRPWTGSIVSSYAEIITPSALR